MKKNKFKFKKIHGVILGIIIVLLTIFIGIWIYVKPMIVSGKIVELSGKVLKYNKSSVVLQAEDGTYNCKIKSDTYFVNNYKIKVGDDVVVIYNYDEKVISKNDNSNEKHVEARRIYKEKEED